MRYIQSNLIFYGFTISFHHSKEVFVCCLIVNLPCVFWVAPSIRGGGIDSPRPASQRAAAFILTAAMLTTFTAPAFAKTWYIENGNITVKAGEAEGPNKVKQGDSDFVKDEGDTIITGTSDKNTVTIDAGNDKVEVTLKDVNIKADSGSALTSNGDVTLTLKGENHLTGGISDNGSYGLSGISSSGSLTISGGETDSLTAQGGSGTDGSGGRGIFSKDLTISGGTVNANGGDGKNGSGGSGITSLGSLTISGGTVNANGGDGTNSSDGGDGITNNRGVTISSGGTVTAKGGSGEDGSGGRGISSFGGVTISSGGTVTATGGNSTGSDGSGGDGISSTSTTISGGTVTADGGSGNFSGGNGIRSFDVAISGGTVNVAGGNGGNGSGSDVGNGIYSSDIDLSGSLELTAKAGSPNGKALSQRGNELDLDDIKDKLGPGAKVTAINANGDSKQVSIPRPVEPEEPVIPGDSSSSSGGGSADASVQESVFPGLVVTDKDGQRISYTSTQSGNTLTVCVGRFTASFHISLAALRQLRAEGIDTITFQTILCSTTLSVDELLAMGGEDAEVVLTHHIRSSTLTVGGKAV